MNGIGEGEVLKNTRRNRRLLAGVVGVNLSLALAVGAGAVPTPWHDGQVQVAAVSQAEEVAAPIARQPGDVTKAAAPVAPPTAPGPTQGPAATTATVAKPPTTTAPPTTKAPTAAPKPAQATSPAPAAATAAAPAPPVFPVKVPRRTPTAPEVQASITELKRQVGGLLMLVSPTPAQIAQAGDQVCTAFDNNQSFDQVKATGLSMIPAGVTVSPATADWAVRQGVALYCPGHSSKLPPKA